MQYCKKEQRSGFTIVELLIVIVVIAILATISIVAYNGVQDRANDSAVKADLTTFGKKLELLRIDATDGLYPASLTAAMGISLTKGSYYTGGWNVYYCTSTDRTTYVIGVISKANHKFYYQNGTTTETTGSLTSTTTCSLAGGSTGTTLTNGFNGASQTWFSWVN